MRRAACLATRQFKSNCLFRTILTKRTFSVASVQRITPFSPIGNSPFCNNRISISQSVQNKPFSKKNLSLKHYLTGGAFFGTMASNTNDSQTKDGSNDKNKNVIKTDNIVASKSDERKYRCITLPNKMDIMLVSDPETEKGACAMAVRVGHFADPNELPGLAHFLEHMLFLGTEKYPNESEYNQYLKDHGGRSNASTGTHDTIYQFDIHSDYLEGAVDRFAQFFISPLFTESATDRELKAVNSENSNNYQSDGWKQYQFDKSLSKKEHPFHKFGTGNVDTLKNKVPNNINVRKELLKFHELYYSSAVMKVCIVGKESLDELEKLAIEKFSNCKLNNNRLKGPQYSSDVFDKNTFPALYQVVPIREQRKLKICWPMRSWYGNYQEKPTSLFGFFLGDEGPGSVLAYLKEKGWANELMGGVEYNMPEFGMSSVTVSLTPEGLKHWEDIVGIIYAYINKMKALNDKQWQEYFEERKCVHQMNFDFKGKEQPYNYSRSMAGALQKYPIEKVLQCMGGVDFGFNVKKTREYLEELTVDNSYCLLIAKDFENDCKETEPWYDTKYNTLKIDNDKLNEWNDYLNGKKKVENDKNLHTPPLNPYIADNFDICCEKNEEKDNPRVPVVVNDENGNRLWYRMDDSFKKPKLYYNFRIRSEVFGETAKHNILSELVMAYLNDALSKQTYAFSEASLNFYAGYGGRDTLSFSFGGYNQKLPLLVDTVLNNFTNLKFDESRFGDVLENVKRQVLSSFKAKPYQHCDVLADYMLLNNSFTIEELVKEVNNVTLNEVKEHYNRFLDNCELYVEGLLFGNIDKNGVKIYNDLLNKYILNKEKYENQKYLNSKQIIDDKKGALKLPQDNSIAHVLQYRVPNEEEKNSAILTDYCYKLDTAKDLAPMKMFLHLISVPCFDTLRTKEQLGYIVWSGSDKVSGMLYVRFIIQSDNSDPIKLDTRIEAFLKEFGEKTLPAITKETFEQNKIAVINNILEKPKTISQLNNQYWGEIASLRYEFDRRQELAKEIENLQLDNVVSFYQNYIADGCSNRCKLTVQSFGKGFEMPKDDKEAVTDKATKTVVFGPDKVEEFRKEYGYHPFGYSGGLKNENKK